MQQVLVMAGSAPAMNRSDHQEAAKQGGCE
jgi:hypothetical protein